MSHDSASAPRQVEISGDSVQESSSRDNARARRRLIRRREDAHRVSLLVQLSTALDLLITVEMAICYYHDNSFLILILRIYGQQMFDHSQADNRNSTAHILFARLFGLNALAAGLHFFFRLNPAGEATRGYSHGGLILDFIGQQGPVFKMQLLFYDFVILMLQLLYLDVLRTKRSLVKQHASSLRHSRRPGNEQISDTTPTIADLDAEERGAAQQEEMQQDGSGNSTCSKEASDHLYAGVADLGNFALSRLINEKMQATDLSHYGSASSVLSNVVGIDIRRRGYTLNVPFRN